MVSNSAFHLCFPVCTLKHCCLLLPAIHSFELLRMATSAFLAFLNLVVVSPYHVFSWFSPILSEYIAGVSKHTWESLVGSALGSHNKWYSAKKPGYGEMSKVLHLAKACKSSSQVLLAAADYLDIVNGYVDIYVCKFSEITQARPSGPCASMEGQGPLVGSPSPLALPKFTKYRHKHIHAHVLFILLTKHTDTYTLSGYLCFINMLCLLITGYVWKLS